MSFLFFVQGSLLPLHTQFFLFVFSHFRKVYILFFLENNLNKRGVIIMGDAKTTATSKKSGGVKATASAAARNKTGNSPGGTMGSEGTQLGFKGTGLKRKN